MNTVAPANLKPLLVGIGEVAAMLNISVAHAKRLRSSGKLPRPISLGRRTLWCVADLEAWCRAECPERSHWERQRGA